MLSLSVCVCVCVMGEQKVRGKISDCCHSKKVKETLRQRQMRMGSLMRVMTSGNCFRNQKPTC